MVTYKREHFLCFLYILGIVFFPHTVQKLYKILNKYENAYALVIISHFKKTAK